MMKTVKEEEDVWSGGEIKGKRRAGKEAWPRRAKQKENQERLIHKRRRRGRRKRKRRGRVGIPLWPLRKSRMVRLSSSLNTLSSGRFNEANDL